MGHNDKYPVTEGHLLFVPKNECRGYITLCFDAALKLGKEKVETFNFLGFTHYCGKSRQGYFIMGHKTSKENLCRKLKETKEWLKQIRNKLRLKERWPVLKSKLTGHYNYFGISGNYRCLQQFYNKIFLIVFKWINRRSQKKSMNLDQLMEAKLNLWFNENSYEITE